MKGDTTTPAAFAISVRRSSSPSRSSFFRTTPVHFLAFLLLVFSGSSAPFSAAMSTSSSGNDSGTAPPVSASDAEAASRTIDFLTMARGLKTTPRTGWVRQGAGPRIESVADHSWRISLMAMVAAGSLGSTSTSTPEFSCDANKCIKMALVHDLAEATVGDITPHCGVSEDDKHARELAAMETMVQALGGSLPGLSGESTGGEILALWKEYEEGTSHEARLVKDMDKLEMILQALEYENDGENEHSLDGFFDSTRDKWRTPIGAAWGKEIESRRRAKDSTEASAAKEGSNEP
ncbi:unnamed protein product [Pseudo-nitzschia multistriata]|uniref:5'-deoxynucleotidase n=1 Tax=Pseudo-nitzschia multistriata TaxID=183589 RepID=A0A448ZQE1_9STRA|nr:unnamed protein product [Pseudo-nitzschia multistriata]